MSMLRWIAEGFRSLESLTPLHDVDLPDDPPTVTDWDAVRDGIDEVRAALMTVLDWLDLIDPTPLALAQAANVTDLNTRKGRQS